jgi:hypothetical protein
LLRPISRRHPQEAHHHLQVLEVQAVIRRLYASKAASCGRDNRSASGEAGGTPVAS